MYQKLWDTCRVVVVPEWNLLLFFYVLVAVTVVVFKLPIKAWTSHRTEKFRVPLLTTELSFLLSFGTRSKFLMQICSVPFSIAISNWPSFVGSKSFHSSHDSATSSKVSGVLQVPPGVLNRILCGKAPPRNPTPYITLFDRKGYLFCIPFVDKWYPFYILMYLRWCYTKRF